jgi:hypothetical protein
MDQQYRRHRPMLVKTINVIIGANRAVFKLDRECLINRKNAIDNIKRLRLLAKNILASDLVHRPVYTTGVSGIETSDRLETSEVEKTDDNVESQAFQDSMRQIGIFTDGEQSSSFENSGVVGQGQESDHEQRFDWHSEFDVPWV